MQAARISPSEPRGDATRPRGREPAATVCAATERHGSRIHRAQSDRRALPRRPAARSRARRTSSATAANIPSCSMRSGSPIASMPHCDCSRPAAARRPGKPRQALVGTAAGAARRRWRWRWCWPSSRWCCSASSRARDRSISSPADARWPCAPLDPALVDALLCHRTESRSAIHAQPGHDRRRRRRRWRT